MASEAISYYVLRTSPIHRIEFQVLHSLTQRDHPAMVPFEEKKLRRKGQRRWRTERYPLFPGYVFVGLRGHREMIDVRRSINEQAERMGKRPPVLGLVGYGGQPAKLTERDVAFLRALSVQRATEVNLHKALQPGSIVSIRPGHWAAGQTIPVDSMTRKGVKVMLSLFNRMQLVEVSADLVEAA